MQSLWPRKRNTNHNREAATPCTSRSICISLFFDSNAKYFLRDALQQTLGLDTRAVSMSDILECDPEPDTETTAHCLLAVGSALRTEKKTL